MSLNPPPIYQPLITDQSGKASLPWILYFNQLFTGDAGTSWTPSFVSLAQTGVPTITGKYYRLSAALAYFAVSITPATNTTATAGTTYIGNFPLTMKGDGICFAVSGLLGSSSGMCEKASNRVYVPAWAAVTVPLTVVGIVEAS